MRNKPFETIVKDFSLFTKANELGIIDMDTLKAQVTTVKEKEYLRCHTQKIWQGKNGFYYTYLIEEGVRKLIKKKEKVDLERHVIDFYKEKDPEQKPTFKIIFEKWLGAKEKYKEVKTASIIRYEDDYRRFILGTSFETLKIEDLNDIVLDEFLRAQIVEKNLTAKSYAGLRTIISGTLKYAKRYHYTDFSVSLFFKDFDLPKNIFKKPSQKRKIVYTKDEREKLYSHLRKSNDVRDLGLALMCLTGLRIGELSALKYEDSTSDCKLYVHRTEARVRLSSGKIIFSVQETSKMDHDGEIVLPKAAQLLINEVHMKTFNDEYLFSDNGHRITARVFRYRLKNACEELGIDYKPPHQMRKTYASILLSAGVDEALIKKEMRHTDISTTRSYYQFVTESKEDEKSIIDKVMGI